ncbi:hypothetical protein [Paenibacillus agricola]|uniref:Uncharacterized protein n=1 Tax=Paenibacillus agricola TaxID=2716264 RepID=A0ABX0JC82_9BACL|nr:hypothetical protein [Paenibacillus agricola]NHN33563.1 hypothetical protein [Paenibacillus agricola]
MQRQREPGATERKSGSGFSDNLKAQQVGCTTIRLHPGYASMCAVERLKKPEVKAEMVTGLSMIFLPGKTVNNQE